MREERRRRREKEKKREKDEDDANPSSIYNANGKNFQWRNRGYIPSAEGLFHIVNSRFLEFPGVA